MAHFVFNVSEQVDIVLVWYCKGVFISDLILTTLKYFRIIPGDQRVFQFEVIIDVFVRSFCFILIPTLSDYGSTTIVKNVFFQSEERL